MILAETHQKIQVEFFKEIRELESSLVDLHKATLHADLKVRLRYYFGKKNLDYAIKQISQKETIMENFAHRTLDKLKLFTMVKPTRQGKKKINPYGALGLGLKK